MFLVHVKLTPFSRNQRDLRPFVAPSGGSGMEVKLTSWVCSGPEVHLRKQKGILVYLPLDLDLDSQSLQKQNGFRGGRLKKISQKNFSKKYLERSMELTVCKLGWAPEYEGQLHRIYY